MAEQTHQLATSRDPPPAAAGPAGSSGTPPRTAADADSSPGPQKGPASTGQIQAQTAMAASDIASHAAPPNSHAQPQEATQQPSTATRPKDAQNEAGNVLAGSTVAGSGSAAPMAMAPAVMLGRDPVTGQLRSMKESASKRQSSADLKPLVARTYDDSPGETLPRERGIKGLDLIPKDWQKLPPNVSLSHEIGWVQSNRLAVVKELPSGGVKVDLTKAYAPAPSHSALGWLETSIRSYAKFIEVASKQASTGTDEAEFVRKERLAISEIRSILAEMMPAKD